MLNKSYAAIQQFQSQFSAVKNFQELKTILNELNLSMIVQLASSSVWILDWDVSGDSISGVMELGISPKIISGIDVFELGYRTLRVEAPNLMSLTAFEERFLQLMKEIIEKMC